MAKKRKEAPAHPNATGGFGTHAPQEDMSPPEMKKVGSEEVLKSLKSIGTGWTDDIKGLLNLPPTLFMIRADNGTLFSANQRFGISVITDSLSRGLIKAEKDDYGIAIYSTGGSVYFVLADLGRKVIVRERLFCVHDSPPEKDWSAVKQRLSSAISAAAAEKEGYAIISDQIQRKVKIS